MKTYKKNHLPQSLQDKVLGFENLYGSLSSVSHLEVYQAKEELISPFKSIDKLRFLLEGRLKISLVHENGSQSIVHFAHPGDFIGELTFLGVEKDHKCVTCLSESIFISVDMNQAKHILKKDADFLFKLCQFVGDKMLRRTNFAAKSQTYDLKHRLAAYILACEVDGIYKEKHTETAEYLSVSYRHLLHTIKGFLDDQVLVKDKTFYHVNISKLKDLAQDIVI